MRIQYVGPHAEGVVVPELGDREIAAGVPVEVPDELGERLLEQASNWAAVGVPPSLRAKKAAEAPSAPAS